MTRNCNAGPVEWSRRERQADLRRDDTNLRADVTRISRIKRCLRLPGNAIGRDLVVGDLHAHARHRKQLRRLADWLASLPLAIHVESRIPFNVLHGDLVPFGSRRAHLFDEEDVCVHEADRSTSSRLNFQAALATPLFSLPFEDRVVRVSDTAFRNLHLTYVGHSPVREVLVHNSYIYIDQGVCQRPVRGLERRPPTVVDHAQFTRWLHGVATAWRPVPPAASGDSIPRKRLLPAGTEAASH